VASGGSADCRQILKEKSKNERLWDAGKTVRRKINRVGRERTAEGSIKKRAKMGGYGVQGKGKEEDEWRHGGVD